MAGFSRAAASPTVAAAIFVALSSGLLPGPARAAFDLQGKTVTVIVSGGVGGGVDAYARTFLPFLVKHLPGNPATIVQNMPGGGGVQGVQQLYNLGPKDGTMIATTPAGPIKEPLMGTMKSLYDLRKFRWFGSLATDDTVCFVWNTSSIRSLDDARAREVPISATGASSNSTLGPLLLNALIGTRFKPISGYDGGTSMLAVERGEVDGRCVTLNDLHTSKPDWINKKLIRILLAVTPAARKGAPEAPYARDLVTTESGRQALDFFSAPDEVQNPFMLPPGTSDEIVDAYRSAFDAATKDPAYMAAAARTRQDVVPQSGAAVEGIIQAMYATSPEVINFVKQATSITAAESGQK